MNDCASAGPDPCSLHALYVFGDDVAAACRCHACRSQSAPNRRARYSGAVGCCPGLTGSLRDLLARQASRWSRKGCRNWMSDRLRPRDLALLARESATSVALDLAARNKPDLVLLDLSLPDLDGLDVIQGLRDWSEVPVVVLSAREAQWDKVDTPDAGADDYVTKPFGMDELLARIRAALRRSGASPRRRWSRRPRSAWTWQRRKHSDQVGQISGSLQGLQRPARPHRPATAGQRRLRSRPPARRGRRPVLVGHRLRHHAAPGAGLG
jgi:CheY-like chemotaxis protein